MRSDMGIVDVYMVRTEKELCHMRYRHIWML